MQHVESWLRADVEGFGFATGADWYVGRPLIVTENDYGLQLFNGDTGVVVAAGDERLVAAFERGETIAQVSPTRLAAVDTVYAMTVHKSQGSQFHTVAFLLPGAGSRLLTRELLYTAVTRAQERLILVGTEESDQGGGRAPDHPGLRFAPVALAGRVDQARVGRALLCVYRRIHAQNHSRSRFLGESLQKFQLAQAISRRITACVQTFER